MHLIPSHSQNFCKRTWLHKLQKKHSGHDFISKKRSFLFRNKTLPKCLNWKDYM